MELRKCEVTLGNLKIDTSEYDFDIDISLSCDESDINFDSCHISIRDVSDRVMKLARSSKAENVIVSAGYGTSISVLCEMRVMELDIRRVGASNQVTIYGRAYIPELYNKFSKSYAKSTPYATIIKDAAQSAGISDASIKLENPISCTYPKSVLGTIKDVILSHAHKCRTEVNIWRQNLYVGNQYSMTVSRTYSAERIHSLSSASAEVDCTGTVRPQSYIKLRNVTQRVTKAHHILERDGDWKTILTFGESFYA